MDQTLISKIFNCSNDTIFEDLALQLFDYQKNNNPIYKSYASSILKNKSPQNIYEIPFLPIEFFKKDQIICTGKGVEKIFLSSGTKGVPSKHLVTNLSIYTTAYTESFKYFYDNIEDYCFLALLPSYQENQDSSLIYMIDDLIKKSRHPRSAYYHNNYKDLSSVITELENQNQKTILFGVTYALLDLANNYPQDLKNTIVMDTGGMKGNRKEIIKEEVHDILKNSFNVEQIHSEYGMTELLSQAYSKGNNIFNSPP